MSGSSRIANKFFDAAAPATKDLASWIPKRKGQHLVWSRTVWLAVFTFGVFGAAVFAEPAVADIEEVIGLIQLERGASG